MANGTNVYTYRAGKKVALEKEPDQFVVRTSPETVRALGFDEAERTSSHSTRVRVPARELETAMRKSRNLAPTHHAYRVADSGAEFLITDRVLVTFKQAMSPADVNAFAAEYALVQKQAYSDREFLFQLTDHTGFNPVKLVVRLTEDEPLVAAAEHDLNQRMARYQHTPPVDARYLNQWHLHTRSTAAAFDRRSSARCEEAWALLDGFGAADVVIGITDDGCKLDHGDFNSAGKFAAWGYFEGERLVKSADIDAQPQQMYQAGANHGTSCAGVAAGEADGVLTVGAAPGCRLLPIKWQSDGPSLFISDSKLLTALNFVANKVDVLSNSWGISPQNIVATMVKNRIAELAQTGGRRGRGILFLWAAGNDNCPIQHHADVSVPFTHGWQVRPDGSAVWIGVRTARDFNNNLVGVPGVLHIAALSSVAQRSHYSNYGTGIAVCAPTSNSHAYFRMAVQGLGVVTATGNTGEVTESFGGTSSATPLVAGVAALVISANPNLTALEVASVLRSSASKNVNFDGYPRTPAASFDPNPNWDVSPVTPFGSGEFADVGSADGPWSAWFGHGKVDAAGAVAAAIALANVPVGDFIEKGSAPRARIPDANPAGIRDRVHFDAEGTVAAVIVGLDVSHTHIGDLRIELAAPSGKRVVLHDRNGGNTDDIRKRYDATSTPALATFVGEAIAGEWELFIQDSAVADVGTLNRWEIKLTRALNDVAEVSESPGIAIPDNNAEGLLRELSVAPAGTVANLEVTFDITHTWIGDLKVSLAAPSGRSVILHDRAGGSADNLISTHRVSGGALGPLLGESATGAWRLTVADLERRDIGKLNRWGLKVTVRA